jgi:hypothetical protein
VQSVLTPPPIPYAIEPVVFVSLPPALVLAAPASPADPPAPSEVLAELPVAEDEALVAPCAPEVAEDAEDEFPLAAVVLADPPALDEGVPLPLLPESDLPSEPQPAAATTEHSKM